MFSDSWLQIILTYLCVSHGLALDQVFSGEYKLVKGLFEGYQKNIRPTQLKDIMYVDIDVNLNKVANVVS